MNEYLKILWSIAVGIGGGIIASVVLWSGFAVVEGCVRLFLWFKKRLTHK